MGLPPDFAPKTEPEQNPNGGQSPGEGVGGGKTFYGCKDFLLLPPNVKKSRYFGNPCKFHLFFVSLQKKHRYMEYSEKIVGDLLTLEESHYKGEYIAKWRGLTVATITSESKGQYAITEWHPDQVSTSTPYYANSLDAAWRQIKNYCRGDFEEELRGGKSLRR